MAKGIKELFVKGDVIAVKHAGRTYGLQLVGDYKNCRRYYKCQLRTGEKHRTYLGAVMAIEAAKLAAEAAAKARDVAIVASGAKIIANAWHAHLG